MDPLTAMAASGMRSRMESLDLLANNIANASTGGYKADREFYSLYAEEENPATMPVIQKPYTDLSQGVLQTTGNQLDLAISGQGFFTVQGPGGSLYTRNGSFRLDSGGKLVSAEGYAVQGTSGALTIPGKLPIEISSDGTVMQDGKVIGQLQIADFTSGMGLVKQGNNYFRATDPGVTVKPPAGSTVEQGKLEASNSGTAESAVRLVSIMRQFEMLQKAASMGADMDKQAIEQVAKI
ncbi:MAG: flagellar basal-body rod protein FlgF [Bryobacteraceae bacterium]|jgi:flagellar basal-body rod protein FlgF